MLRLLQTSASLRESLDIDVRTENEVLSIDREKRTVAVRDLSTGREYTEHYDALALCTGAEPVRPPLPGIDLPGIHVLRRIGDMDAIKMEFDKALDAAKLGSRGAVRCVVIGRDTSARKWLRTSSAEPTPAVTAYAEAVDLIAEAEPVAHASAPTAAGGLRSPRRDDSSARLG